MKEETVARNDGKAAAQAWRLRQAAASESDETSQEVLDVNMSSWRRRNEMAEAYREWMPRLTTRADLTLRLRTTMAAPGGRVSLALTDDLATATVTRFFNRLNGRALGRLRRVGRCPRLDGLAWLEHGALTGRLHVHALVERPPSWPSDSFNEAVAAAWRAQPFGYDELKVGEITSLAASIAYNSKTGRRFENLAYAHHELDATACWREHVPAE